MLYTHRNGVIYLEHCKIVASDERLTFVRAEKAIEKHFSLPYANMCVLLLGPGTSVTHRAAFKMAEEGVVYGFVGGGGTPLFHASLSEYRPTEFCQKWVTSWQSLPWRREASKELARIRVEQVAKHYPKIFKELPEVEVSCQKFLAALQTASTPAEIMGHEAVFAKSMYAQNRRFYKIPSFTREPAGTDDLNKFIDNGNYLAYGLAASVLWVLGIPHAMPVTHGMTRRGALVFDLADTVKDALLLPLAFEAYNAREKAREHRLRCISALDRGKAMVGMFNTINRLLALTP